MKFLKLFKHLFIFILLTLLTQVGGVIWLFSIWISKLIEKKKRLVFPILYLVFNFLIIPPLAKVYGREALPVLSSELKPRNLIYPLLFRNYVTKDLKNILQNSANTLKKDHIIITYLDANFPFIDDFPLLPHLSHNDGKKVDISFMYLDSHGKTTNKKPSISGYGIYVDNAKNTTSKNCIDKGYWQYDFTKHLTFGSIYDLKFDNSKTKLLIKQLLRSPKTEKIFIEPYLKKALDLSDETKIRFHCCKAVRHDDHIHLQIK